MNTTTNAFDTELPFLHGLCALRPRLTALRLQALLARAGSPMAAWKSSESLRADAGFTPEGTEVFLRHRTAWDLEAEILRLQRDGLRLVAEHSPEYPPLLRQIHDPPIGLYVRDRIDPAWVFLAVVGSRKASPYGRTVTSVLVRPLAARGLTIVSGLAYGIDAEAHRATLAVHGTTIAVLGSGADDTSLYPRAHRPLAHEIVTAGGAVLSEFPPGTEPRPELFPQRNRIIAGMSRAVLVVEATVTSGALITARLTLDGGRDVLVVPGPITSPTSEGTNRLLREGATPVCSADDVLSALELTETLRLPSAGEGPGERPAAEAKEPTGAILRALALEPRSLDDLVATTTLPVHEVAATLSLLELDGCVRDVGGKQYVRV